MPVQDLASEVSFAVRKWRNQRGALIMILHEIQSRHGYIPRSVALEVAKQAGIPLARIYEVLTFYHFFELEPPAAHVINVCMGTACYLKGAPDLIDAFSKHLGISQGETTPDKEFCLQTVRCVGCCGLAPVVLLDGKTCGKLQTSDVEGLIEEARSRKEESNGAHSQS